MDHAVPTGASAESSNILQYNNTAAKSTGVINIDKLFTLQGVEMFAKFEAVLQKMLVFILRGLNCIDKN